MRNESRFEIPDKCREFGETSFDKRLDTAKRFIEKFVESVAPPKALDESNDEWTKCVRGRFIDICPSDCYAIPKDRCTPKGEFLADYTWEEKENGKRLLLASESEWGTDRFGKVHWYRVEEDFEKLPSIKATFKVLIFSSDEKLPESKGAVEGDFSIGFAKNRIEAALSNFGQHLAGETYILIDFPRTGKPESNGIYRSFIWVARKFGKGEVKFEDGGNGDLIRP